MTTTIGWDPFDWSDGLREIVTCVSVGGRAVPELTTSRSMPRNDGSLVISLTLPVGVPGSLICEQSILLGAGSGQRTTSPVCFKLRAGETPPGSGAPAPGSLAAPAPPVPAPPSPAPAAPAGPPVPGPQAPMNPKRPATYPASTPPARAAFEAARGGFEVPAVRPVAPDPVARVAVPAPAWPDPVSTVPAARPRPSAVAAGAAPTPGIPAGAPVASLARTGIDEHIPLASAGGFLAIGGAAIIFSAPGRRRRPRPTGSRHGS